jgi:hypothetical protein
LFLKIPAHYYPFFITMLLMSVQPKQIHGYSTGMLCDPSPPSSSKPMGGHQLLPGQHHHNSPQGIQPGIRHELGILKVTLAFVSVSLKNNALAIP